MFNNKKLQEAETKAEAEKILRVKAEGATKVEKAKLKKSEELVAELKDQIKVLTSRVEKTTKLKEKELALDQRESIVKAKETNQETFTKELKKLEDEVKTAIIFE